MSSFWANYSSLAAPWGRLSYNSDQLERFRFQVLYLKLHCCSWYRFMLDSVTSRFCRIRMEAGVIKFIRVNVIMSSMASQIIGVSIVYSTVCSGADQGKHQSSVLLAFVWGIHQWPVDSPHKGPVTRKMFPFDDIIMLIHTFCGCARH